MKKLTKKIWAVAMAVVMVLAMAVTAFAAGTGTITIKPPTNTPGDATNTYKIYKVFDAVVSEDGSKISYKLVSGKTTAPAGFSVDTAGNVTYTGTGTSGQLTADDIAKIAEYVVDDTPVKTVTSTGTANAVASELAIGYYYITTSTGTAVTVDSTTPNVTVNDKNTVPIINKKITGASYMDNDGQKAIQQVGSEVSYQVNIVVQKNTKNLKFTDTLDSTLKLNQDSISIKVGESAVDSKNYTMTLTDTTINIVFEDSYTKELNNTITITYKATVTSDALTVDPAENTATIKYGDNDVTITSETPKVYNATITVTKIDDNNAALAGAGFVLKNNEEKYYKLSDNVLTWVTNIADATELTTTEASNVVAFTGLANGKYTLIENTVPEGYNKAADKEITINDGDYTAANLSQTEKVVNNAGTALPSTGGIGTTMFYAIGAILVLFAGVLLVTRRRMSAK